MTNQIVNISCNDNISENLIQLRDQNGLDTNDLNVFTESLRKIYVKLKC